MHCRQMMQKEVRFRTKNAYRGEAEKVLQIITAILSIALHAERYL